MRRAHDPMTKIYTSLSAAAFVLAVIVPGTLRAQQSDDAPAFRFGLSTGFVASDNRGLDPNSLGSTFEATARLDFGMTFATPIQQLDLTGDIGLRAVSGAESGTLENGLTNPSLAIAYARQARDAQISLDVFAREADASTTNLEVIEGVPDPTLVTADGTSLRYGFDTELELRRRSPFGITLSAGYTALRYSNTTSATLTDQDRTHLGVRLRFDLNPSTQATMNLRYSTFEDFGTPEGVRETYTLDNRLRQDLRNGDMSVSFNVSSTEDGERYTLSTGRSVSTPVWDLGGTLGLTRATDGDIYPVGTLDLARTLPDGSLAAALSRSIGAGIDDDEQEITSLRLTYAKQFSPLTSFNASFSYSETDPTGAGSTSSLSSVGISLQRSLTPTWDLNVGLDHRISKSTAGTTARDNRLSVTLRHDLSARR